MSKKDAAIRVSVIMANHNGAAHIAAAVTSVLRQSEPALELIISDDASSDDSLDIAQSAASGDPRLVLLKSETRGGPAAARNRALAAARGAWVAIVDNDDHIDTDRLEQLLNQAETDGADVAADNLISFYDDAPQQSRLHLPARFTQEPQWISAAAYVDADNGSAGLGYLKPVFRRAAFGDALRYDEALHVGEDAQLMTQLLSGGARLRLYPEAWYHYRKRRGSISHRQRPETIDAMIAALDRIAPGDDLALAAAIAQRRSNLLDARNFIDLVAALKARDAGAAARLAIKRPSALRLLGEPIATRLGLRPRT